MGAAGSLAAEHVAQHQEPDEDAGRSDDELERRRSTRQPESPVAVRGWTRLYVDHVLQADRGCDLDFLVGSSGSEVTRESH